MFSSREISIDDFNPGLVGERVEVIVSERSAPYSDELKDDTGETDLAIGGVLQSYSADGKSKSISLIFVGGSQTTVYTREFKPTFLIWERD